MFIDDVNGSLAEWENEGGHFVEMIREEFDVEKSLLNPLWGEQTERSLKYFNIGQDFFDTSFIRAMLTIKKSMAQANEKFGLLEEVYSTFIIKAIDLFLTEDHFNQFPVRIWQTGSGTQINMNINEVIANVATKLANDENLKIKIHPNDHVNMSQSSNDSIPSAMNIAATSLVLNRLIPTLDYLERNLLAKEMEFCGIFKVGRTHLRDAVPMSLGQEFSCFRSQIKDCRKRMMDVLERTRAIPLGGTAVGTGINCPKNVSDYAIKLISKKYRLEFKKMDNLFSGISASDSIVELSGQLKTLATVLMKMSSDISLLSSGPDAGLNELSLPQNEAGSSIMPGKVNPTQCEALSMVCCQVIGNDTAITVGGVQGTLQLNTFRPLMIKNIDDSINLLCDSIKSFTDYCIKGIQANKNIIKKNLKKTKMIITMISPLVGYDQAEKIVQKANEENVSVLEEIVNLGYLTQKELEEKLDLVYLTNPPSIPNVLQ